MKRSELLKIITDMKKISVMAKQASSDVTFINDKRTVLINPEWLVSISDALEMHSDSLGKLFGDEEVDLKC